MGTWGPLARATREDLKLPARKRLGKGPSPVCADTAHFPGNQEIDRDLGNSHSLYQCVRTQLEGIVVTKTPKRRKIES